MSHVKKKSVTRRKNAQPSPIFREVSSGETSSSSSKDSAQLEPVQERPTAEHGGAVEGNISEEDKEVRDRFCLFCLFCKENEPDLN